MDGSLVAFLAAHPAAATFGLLASAAIGYALFRHSAACKDSRRQFHAAITANTSAVHALGERVAALEALGAATNRDELASAIASALRRE